MIIAAHQPHYMPWLGYLDKVAKADLFVVMDDLQFTPRNFQNRQRLKLAHPTAWLTIPISRRGRGDLLKQQIDNAATPKQHWQHRHWGTLVSCYGTAPFFGLYADELHDVYTRPWQNLVDLDLHMLALAMRWLDIHTPIERSSRLGLTGTKTDRLIDLCTKLRARCYLSGGGGSTSYLDVEKIGRAGFGVIWQHFDHPVYPQRDPAAGFVSHLGFLDLLLNCGPKSRDVLFERSHPIHVATRRAKLPTGRTTRPTSRQPAEHAIAVQAP